MTLSLITARPATLYAQLRDDLKSKILDGIHQPGSRLIEFRYVPASARVQERLALGSGSSVGEIHRVRLLDGKPVSLEITWLPSFMARRLERSDLAQRDIFSILENDCGIRLGHADVAIDAIAADRRIAASLGVAEGVPVMHVERLTYDCVGRPLDYEHLYYRGDAFQYRFRTERQLEKVS